MASKNQYTMPDEAKAISGTLKSFKGITEFFEFFNEDFTEAKIHNGSGTYADLWADVSKEMSNRVKKKEKSWYGEPFPSSLEEAIARDEYQNMDDYKKVYKEIIEPRIQDILKQSTADLDMPTLKYNDLGLGTFDFNKASTGLIALYKYYSFKKKGLVDGNLVETYKDKDKYKYKLKSDGTEVILVPEFKGGFDSADAQKALKEISKGENVFAVLKKYNIKIGGEEAFTSTIKKSYILKEKKAKPKNAIRIFVQMGNSSGVSWPAYKYSGYTAIGVAQLLTILGYAVSIIGVIGIKGDIYGEKPVRYYGATLKRFDETLNPQSLLYVVSDPTFFRIKFFEIIIKGAQFYNDYIDNGLGYPAHLDELKSMIFSEYGKRDGLFNPKGERKTNSEFLYYIFADIMNEQEMSQTILDIGLNSINENVAARAKLLGDEEYELYWDNVEKKVKRREIKKD